MKKETKRKIVGIGILLFGATLFVVGNVFVKDFVGFWESLSEDTNIQIILMWCCFFAPISMCLAFASAYLTKKDVVEG